MNKTKMIIILLFALGTFSLLAGVVINHLNREMAQQLWDSKSSLGGLADVPRYLAWQKISFAFSIFGILVYGVFGGYIASIVWEKKS